jgi:hypothetical protein
LQQFMLMMAIPECFLANRMAILPFCYHAIT